MQKNNEFSYTENGVTIIFNELPKKEYQKGPHFEFEVQDNPMLTEKLKKSVSGTRVRKKYLFEYAKNLFSIIASGKFEEVVTRKRAKLAFEKFKKLTEENPRFVVKKISEYPQKMEVTLSNSYGLTGIIAEAKNAFTAKVLAVEKYIDLWV